MGRIKDWLMEMEEDALHLSDFEFVNRHVKDNKDMVCSLNYSEPNHPFEFYNDEDEDIFPAAKNSGRGNSEDDDIPF